MLVEGLITPHHLRLTITNKAYQMETKQCQSCGNNFNIKPSQSNKIYCNLKCKQHHSNILNTKQCLQCGNDYVSKSKTSKYCSRKCLYESARTLTRVFKCEECSKEFKEKGNSNNRFCTRECSFKNMNDNKLSNILTTEELKKRAKDKSKRNRKLVASCNLHECSCIYCDTIFYSKKGKKHCSKECRMKASRVNSALSRGYKIERICNVCSKDFNYLDSPHYNQCSDKCFNVHQKIQKRKNRTQSQKHNKRARRLNAVYELGITIKKLLMRDGNKCLICNKKVLEVNVSGYHKENATIGHIIAMANGGSHTWANIQMECMECNTKKGVKDGGQLRLF